MTTALNLTAIDSGLEALAETDPARRAELIAAAWTPDATFVDPMFAATGHDEIAAVADAVVNGYPGQRFVRTTEVDEHHGFIRYGWALVAPDGAVTVTGLDVAQLADDGRIRTVTGFFGDLHDLVIG
jgi:hypothetical protein